MSGSAFFHQTLDSGRSDWCGIWGQIRLVRMECVLCPVWPRFIFAIFPSIPTEDIYCSFRHHNNWKFTEIGLYDIPRGKCVNCCRSGRLSTNDANEIIAIIVADSYIVFRSLLWWVSDILVGRLKNHRFRFYG